jgi:HTH-type transcriptional regulator / antitoxin HigA
MKIKPIKSKRGYGKAVKRMGEIWDARPGTPEEVELKTLLLYIEDYEEVHFRPFPPDLLQTMQVRMEDSGLNATARMS